MKIKHVQGEGMPMDTLKRGRGRPKKDGYGNYAPASNNRLDPTGDLFLRTEQREGGPIDPMTTFEDNVNLLFRDKFPNGPTSHPMYPYLNQFSFHNTPGGPMETNETEIKQDCEAKKNFKEISQEILGMTEPKKNMLNCDELMSIYLRECSAQVNASYYETIIQFLLMFRDCLNMYGW